jgi:transposase
VLDLAQEAAETVILATDEATLYLQATTCHVWAPVGQTPLVRVTPARDSQRFYGTLNLLTGEELVMPAATCNAAFTAQHLQQILDHYPMVNILLLWDKAPWHAGEPIRDLLRANPRLELMPLPTAAPDLNPQEHVWKAVRQAVSHNHSTTRLPDLVDKWLTFLRSHTFPCSLLDDLNFYNLRAIATAFT